MEAPIRALLFNKAFIEVSMEYFNYSNVFSIENIMELSEQTRINGNIIKLKKVKQPFFGPIYNLRLVELKTLKTYIETNLANGVIRLFKPPTNVLILFD